MTRIACSLSPAVGAATLMSLLLPLARPSLASSLELIRSASPAAANIKVVFEVDGRMLTHAAKPNEKPNEVELRAKGQFLYEERLDSQRAGDALRYYEQAAAQIAVDGRPLGRELREDRRYMVVDASAKRCELRSLQGSLTREELELLEVPGGSHCVDQLLPGRAVKEDETWTHDDALLAQLLNLDAITVNEVVSRIASVDPKQGLVQLHMSGQVLGYVTGATTELKVQGKYTYDPRRQRITWLALGIQEKREIGVQKPGLDVRARVRMLVQEDTPQHLSPEDLEQVVQGAPEPTPLLEYHPPHDRFTLLHERRWHVSTERPELIVMRMIEDNKVIAQCNLRALPPQGSTLATSLSHFQEQIRLSLGSAAQQIVDANESLLPNGVGQLRVSVVGEVAKVPVHWIFYHLTDESRQVVTCAFTMSGENVDRFGAEDVSFVGNVLINSPPEPGNESKELTRRADEDPVR